MFASMLYFQKVQSLKIFLQNSGVGGEITPQSLLSLDKTIVAFTRNKK